MKIKEDIDRLRLKGGGGKGVDYTLAAYRSLMEEKDYVVPTLHNVEKRRRGGRVVIYGQWPKYHGSAVKS